MLTGTLSCSFSKLALTRFVLNLRNPVGSLSAAFVSGRRYERVGFSVATHCANVDERPTKKAQSNDRLDVRYLPEDSRPDLGVYL